MKREFFNWNDNDFLMTVYRYKVRIFMLEFILKYLTLKELKKYEIVISLKKHDL